VLRVPHEAEKGEPLLLLCVTPSAPIIFEVISRIFKCGRPYALAIASSDEVDEKAVEEVRHFVLLLSCSTLSEALNKENGLEHPKIWLSGEASIGEDLWSEVVVDANLQLFSKRHLKDRGRLTAS
jgi:hypothetical protein